VIIDDECLDATFSYEVKKVAHSVDKSQPWKVQGGIAEDRYASETLISLQQSVE
jgi:hypothetical protein